MFYSESGDDKSLSLFLSEKKNHVLSLIENYSKSEKNTYVNKQIKNVVKNINEINESQPDDNTIIKFLTLSNLAQEITRGTNE